MQNIVKHNYYKLPEMVDGYSEIFRFVGVILGINSTKYTSNKKKKRLNVHFYGQHKLFHNKGKFYQAIWTLRYELLPPAKNKTICLINKMIWFIQCFVERLLTHFYFIQLI